MSRLSIYSNREWNKLLLIKFILILISLLLILFSVLYFNVANVSADNVINKDKLVTSVKIEKGDTLWSIAKEYFSDDYKDMNEFIKEIKLSNGLYSDTIHEGHYIIVPYYSSNNSQ